MIDKETNTTNTTEWDRDNCALCGGDDTAPYLPDGRRHFCCDCQTAYVPTAERPSHLGGAR